MVHNSHVDGLSLMMQLCASFWCIHDYQFERQEPPHRRRHRYQQRSFDEDKLWAAKRVNCYLWRYQDTCGASAGSRLSLLSV